MIVHKHHVFVAFLYGIIYGVAVSLFVDVDFAQIILLFSGLVFTVVAGSTHKWRWWIIGGVAVVGCALGVWRTQQVLHWIASPSTIVGQKITWSAVVVGEVRSTDYGQRVVVSLRTCHDSNRNTIPCDGIRTLVSTTRYTDLLRLRMAISGQCTFAPVHNFLDQFDYQMYLAKSGVRSICQSPQITSGEHTRFMDKMFEYLMRVRYQMESHIAHAVAQPAGALATGLLFGGDERLSAQIQQQFARTGLTHIVAVSGFNVTVIAQYLVLLGIALGLWRRHAVWMAIGGIFLFVAIIGFPTPAVRAGIMGVLVLLVMRAGRVGQALPAVLFAGVVMILYNPLIMRYDVGFQLSFLATLGIILLYPLFERWFVRGASVAFLKELFFLTVSAQIFVVPILAYYFGVISVISLVANILVLPVIPLAMMLAFLVAVIGYVSTSGALFVGGFLYVLLVYVFWVVQFFAQIPWATKAVTFTTPEMMAFYGILGISVIAMRARLRKDCL